jgi:glyoxylase-like metal-dependent hydrolase (beta-lactamase superfamily II)
MQHKPYSLIKQLKFSFLKDGDAINVGNYTFQCVETPGHTTGHMCLYESSKKILISGDHILNVTTPNISLLDYRQNLLGEYVSSLDKVYKLYVELVLPGHGDVFRGCKKE